MLARYLRSSPPFIPCASERRPRDSSFLTVRRRRAIVYTIVAYITLGLIRLLSYSKSIKIVF